MYTVKFTDIGEGLHEGTVGEIHVKDNDAVKEGDSLFSVETDKLTSDIPCPVDGKVFKVLIKTGDLIRVGQDIFVIDQGDGKGAAPVASTPQTAEPKAKKPVVTNTPAPSVQDGEFQYDAIVIGAGPGGYSLVEILGEAGLKIAIVEKEYLGGVCLNVGCIPTKALLKSAKVIETIKHATNLGVDVPKHLFKMNWADAQTRKQEVVDKLVSGVGSIVKNAKADLIEGTAEVTGPNTVKVNGRDYTAKNIVIATGSSPIILNLPGFKEALESKIIIDSTGALKMNKLPKSMVIVGGGVIGVEFAYLFNSIGVEVTIIEGTDAILPLLDNEVKKIIHSVLTKDGIKIYTSAMVKSFEKGKLIFEHENKMKKIGAEKILLSVGRRANNLGVDKIGVKVNRDGAIDVDEEMRSSIPSIYAIGDVVNKIMLAHVAYGHAKIVASSICGTTKFKYNRQEIPSCVYIHPEIASVGYTEEELNAKGIKYVKGVWQNAYLGKALADGDTVGMTKLLIGAKYGEILGAHIVNATASDMISEIVVAIKSELTIYELYSAIHPHPSTAESIVEAAKIAKLKLEKLHQNK